MTDTVHETLLTDTLSIRTTAIFNSACIVIRFIQQNDSAIKIVLDHILTRFGLG